MKRAIAIIAFLLALVLTHGAAWCLGWRSGFIRMGWTDARTDMRMTMHAARALQSNDLARASHLVHTQLRWDVERLRRTETDRQSWFSDWLNLSLEEMCTPADVFEEVTVSNAQALIKKQQKEPNTSLHGSTESRASASSSAP